MNVLEYKQKQTYIEISIGSYWFPIRTIIKISKDFYIYYEEIEKGKDKDFHNNPTWYTWHKIPYKQVLRLKNILKETNLSLIKKRAYKEDVKYVSYWDIIEYKDKKVKHHYSTDRHEGLEELIEFITYIAEPYIN